jgi:peptidoglycan biosynthesis protein MviN/MurJ (putative lipid II flippase)
MLRRILVIGGSGVLGALGLALVQIRVGALFGVSGELDAFFVGAALPSVLLAIGAGTISAFVVPRLPRDDPAATAASAGRMATLALLFSLPVTLLLVVAAPLVVAVVAPGLDSEVARTAARVLRVYSLSAPFTAMVFAYYAYGFASGRIWTAGLTTAVYGLAWLGLLFVPTFGDTVTDVAVAGLIATTVQLATAFLLSSSGLPRPWPVLRPGRVSRPALLALGAVLGAAIVARSGLLLDPLFGSFLPEGAVSELAYATRIAALAIFVAVQGAAYGLLIIGAESQIDAGADFRVGLVVPLLLATSAAAVLAIAGPPLAELILARGELRPADAQAVGELLRLWAPGVIAFTLVAALEMLLYAQRRTAEVLWRGLAGLSVNVVASAVLVALLDADGRPLGVLAGVVAQLGLLLWLMRDDERIAVLRATATWRRAALHAAAAAALMGLVYVGLNGPLGGEPAALIGIGLLAAYTLLALRAYQLHELALASDSGAPPPCLAGDADA